MEEKQLYDDAFYVVKQRWGTWRSYDKEDKPLITSLTEKDCVSSSRFYLQLLQENRLNEVGTIHNGNVEHKL